MYVFGHSSFKFTSLRLRSFLNNKNKKEEEKKIKNMKEIFNETFAFCAMIQQYDSPFHKLYSFSVDHDEKNSKSQTTPSN